jgi:peptidoglycan/LPS O-acetylase OafA/YrhL
MKLNGKGRLLGILLALATGVAVVGATTGAFTLLTGSPIAFSSDVVLFQVAIVAIPFLILAAIGVGDRRPWLVGLALTLALWGYYLFVVCLTNGIPTGPERTSASAYS